MTANAVTPFRPARDDHDAQCRHIAISACRAEESLRREMPKTDSSDDAIERSETFRINHARATSAIRMRPPAEENNAPVTTPTRKMSAETTMM